MAEHSFRAMGSQIVAIVDAPEPAARPALHALAESFFYWERALSRFQADSELSQLNRAAGGWAAVSPAMAAVLKAALHTARATDGLVVPTLLDALERAGYAGDFAGVADDDGPPAAPQPPADWRQIRLDARHGAVYLPPGARLDLGGVAKGWAAECAARDLAHCGPALVDAGGDIALSGPRADGSPWPIAVGDPRGGDAPLDTLLLRAGGVATSGRDHRRWRRGGREQHHIIDPRSGAPAATDLLSVTVVASRLTEAEAAAKAALILGSRAGLAWLAARPQLAGLLVCADGAIIRTASLDAVRWAAQHSPA